MNGRKLARLGIGPSLVAFAALAGSVAPAFADLQPGTILPYEIEAKEQYCSNGTTSCVPQNGPPKLGDLRFAIVEVYRVSPVSGDLEKTTHGTVAAPEVLIAKCTGPHFMDARGNIHVNDEFVYIGPQSLGPEFDGGTVTGSVRIRHGLESDTESVANLALEGFDPMSGDRVVVTGEQVANIST